MQAQKRRSWNGAVKIKKRENNFFQKGGIFVDESLGTEYGTYWT